MKHSQQNSIAIGASLLIFSLFALVISTGFFFKESLRLDEAQGLWQTSQSIPMILKLTSTNVHVPGYHILLHLWQVFIGSDLFSARLLSTIFMVLSIPATYFLAKRLYDQKVAIYAAMLFSLSPFVLWYGSEVRMYMFFAFLAIIHQILFMRIFRGGGDWAWILFGFISVLGIYVHYFFFLVLLTEAIFYYMYRKSFPENSRLRFGIVLLVIAASFLPWVVLVLFSLARNNSSPMLEQPSSVDIFNVYSQILFGFQNDFINSILLATWPLGIALAFLALGQFRKLTEETVFLILFIIVPVSAAFLLSFIQPVFLTRYLTLVAPSLFIFIAWFLSQYPPRLAYAAKLGLVVVMMATLGIQIEAEDVPVKEPFREVVEYLEQEVTVRDVIVTSAPFTIYPIEYFYNGNTVIKTLPIWNRYVEGPLPTFSSDRLEADVETISNSHEKLFLILSYDQGYEEEIRQYFDHNYHKLAERKFTSNFEVRVYRVGYASDYFRNRILFPNP